MHYFIDVRIQKIDGYKYIGVVAISNYTLKMSFGVEIFFNHTKLKLIFGIFCETTSNMVLLQKFCEPKNSVNFEFSVNGWSKTTLWCDVYSKIDLSLV